MRRPLKVKTHRVLSRKVAMSASAASRRPFPAWIVADESGVAFPAHAGVTPRIRDGLILRRVSKQEFSSAKSAGAKGATYDHRAR
jgi:hypothetical protein